MSMTLKRETETDLFISTQSSQSTKAEHSFGSIDIFGLICPLLTFICLYNTSVQEALSAVFVESPNSNRSILQSSICGSCRPMIISTSHLILA